MISRAVCGIATRIARRRAVSRLFAQVGGGKDLESDLTLPMERRVLQYHSKLAKIKAEEMSFSPPKEALSCLKRVQLDPEIANIGINLADLEVYMVDHPTFNDFPKNNTNSPSASWMRVVFPFESQPNLKRGMVDTSGKHIRVGRLLEIMDLMAERIGYLHCNGPAVYQGDRTVVTASVDGIYFYPNELDISKSITLEVRPA